MDCYFHSLNWLNNEAYNLDDVLSRCGPVGGVVLLKRVVFTVCILSAKACYVMAGDRCHVESGVGASQVPDVDDVEDDAHHHDDGGDVRLTR